MSQARYGDGSAGGRRIVDLPEPIDKAFGLPGLSALKTSAKTVGVGQTANALSSIVKPKIASGLGTLTKTPGRTAATIGGAAVTANLAGRHTGRNQVYNGLAKRDGRDHRRGALVGAGVGGAVGHAATGTALGHFGDAMQAASSGKVPSIRNKAKIGAQVLNPRVLRHNPILLAPAGAAAAFGALNGGVAGTRRKEPTSKAYIPEERRQRRLGMYEAGLGLTGAAAGVKGANGIRRTTASSRHAAKLTSKWKDQGTHAALKHGLTARPKDIALVGGGAALLGGAGLVRQHAEGKSNRRWS